VHFYSTETRKIVVEPQWELGVTKTRHAPTSVQLFQSLLCTIIAYYHNTLTINCTITLA